MIKRFPKEHIDNNNHDNNDNNNNDNNNNTVCSFVSLQCPQHLVHRYTFHQTLKIA